MIWRNVTGWPYLVSNTGVIKHITNDRELKPRLTRKGYYRIVLCSDTVRKDIFVHRVVAMAFIPNPENLPVVNHKDGIKTNNHLDNLEWCSIGYNQLHAYSIGLRKKSTGENHWRSKTKQKA